jgi:hypothetical protein
MAAPGTNELIQNDTLNKQRTRNVSITTQPGGVVIQSGLGQITGVQATITTFITEPVSLSAVVSSDKRTVTLFSTSDAPLTADIFILGYE